MVCMCKAVTQSALSGIVCFPELHVNCATLDYKSCQCCPVSGSSHCSQCGVTPCASPAQAGTRVFKSSHSGQVTWLGSSQRQDSHLCTVGLETSYPSSRTLFLSPIVHIHLFATWCKKSVSVSNILIWTTLQWGALALRQITSYFRWVLFSEVEVCLNKAFTSLTSNLVW